MRPGVAADVGEPLLDDPEDLDLLIRAELDGALDREVHVELAVRRQELDVAAGVPESIAGELSAREVEVLILLDEHLGTDEIARRLFISEHTVRT